jgi:hypothetical protein
MSIFKALAIIAGAIGLLDLLFGNTNQPILPSFLGNVLTQNIDAVLIGAAVLVLVFL